MNWFWKYKVDHVLFWAATIGFHMFTKVTMVHEAGLDQFVLEVTVRNGLLAILIYSNLSLLIPRYAQQKKVLTYAILLSITLWLYVFLKNAHDVYLNGYILGDESWKAFFYNTYYNLSIAIFYLSFSVALHLSKAW